MAASGLSVLLPDASINQACFPLSAAGSTCALWLAPLQPLSLPQIVPLLDDLETAKNPINSTRDFDSTVKPLPFVRTWAKQFACPGLKDINPTTDSFPVRFAESWACTATVNNMIRGSASSFGKCINPSATLLLPSLCKETCLSFAKSFQALRPANSTGDSEFCLGPETQTPEAVAAIVSFNTQANVYNSICNGLRSMNDPVLVGQLPCVQMSVGDFVSCGFGNTTNGVSRAKDYCKTASSPCCAYLGSSYSKALIAMGGTIYSGTNTPGPAFTIVIGFVVGIAVGVVLGVFGIGWAAFSFYPWKRIGEGGLGGGLGGAGVIGGSAGKVPNGIVVGKGSRLSFMPGRRPYQNVQEDVAPPMPALPPPRSNSRPIGGGDSGGIGRLDSKKRLGPSANVDYGGLASPGFGSVGSGGGTGRRLGPSANMALDYSSSTSAGRGAGYEASRNARNDVPLRQLAPGRKF